MKVEFSLTEHSETLATNKFGTGSKPPAEIPITKVRKK